MAFKDLKTFSQTLQMDGEERVSGLPGSDIALSICKGKDGAFNVILRGKISDDLAIYAELIFLLSNATEQDNINIFISSPGGSVFSGIAIASAIMESKATVSTIIAGLAASIAAVIWLAGKNLYVLPYSLLMIHGSSHFDGGKSVLVAKKATEYNKFSQYINSTAVRLGIISEEEFLTITEDHHDKRIFGSDLLRRCKVWEPKVA